MRNHLLDNAKAAFMVMVVLGHLLEPMRVMSGTTQALYLYLYAFHIPGLALLSGAVWQPTLSTAAVRKSARDLLVPVLVFEVLYEALYAFNHGHISPYAQGFQPYWLLWYLPSLFLWRLILPLVCSVRVPLIASILIGVVAGCTEGMQGFFFDASRTLVLFPFFVAGYQWRSILHIQVPSTLTRVLAGGILICGAALAFEFRGEYPNWLYGSECFAAFGVPLAVGAAIRVALYIFSAALVWAVISLLPRSETPLGQRSANILYVYLWHGIFIRAADDSGLFGLVGTFPPALTYTMFSGLALLAFVLLSSGIVKRLTDRVLLFRH
jgi:fucose 4-O-acetylase-like acetyltransferase